MKKTIKWFFLILGVFTVTLILVLLALSYLISTEKFKKPLLNQISTALNREVSIKETRLSLFPWMVLHCTDIQVLEEDSTQEKLLVMDELEIKIRFLSLLRGKPQIEKISFNGPNLQIIRLPNGQSNLTTLFSTTPKGEISKNQKPPPAFLLGLTISEFSISNGNIRLIDQRDPRNISKREFKNINLNLENVSLTRPIDVSLSLELEETPKRPLSYKGQITPDLKAEKVTLKNHRIRLGEIELLLSGSISEIQTNPIFSISLQGKQLPLAQTVQLAKTMNIPTPEELNLDGWGSLEATLEGSRDQLNVSLNVDLKDSSLDYKNLFKKRKGLPANFSFQTSWGPESSEKSIFNFDYLITGLTQTDPNLNVSLQGQITLDFDKYTLYFTNHQGTIEELPIYIEGKIITIKLKSRNPI